MNALERKQDYQILKKDLILRLTDISGRSDLDVGSCY